MTLEFLGNLGELIGGIGVIISVLYLAFQLRQNSKLLRMGNLQQTLDASRQNFVASMAGHNIAALLVKTKKRETLTEEEAQVFQFWFNAQMRNFEIAYLQYQGGALDGEIIDAIAEKVAIAVASPSGLDAWREIRTQSPKSFVDWVEGIRHSVEDET